MDTKRITFLLFIVLIFAFIFIRSHYLLQADYKNKLQGIIVDTKSAKRGSLWLYVYSDEKKMTIKKAYLNLNMYESVKIGDSIIKNNNSWHIQVYRNFGKRYQFVDSFGIGRGTNSY
jgi:D-mannonate dehydratase